MTGRALRLFLCVSGALLIWRAGALAHGADCRPVNGACAVEGIYDNGRPMAFCDVAVYAGAKGDSAALSGATDAAGRFAFVPGADGEWRVVIDDGMGHAASCRIEVAGGAPSSGSEGGGPGRLYGGIAGVGAIFGVFGLYALIRSRRVR